jgi:hypothetical protein
MDRYGQWNTRFIAETEELECSTAGYSPHKGEQAIAYLQAKIITACLIHRKN